MVAQVDDEDYEVVGRYKWYSWKHRNTFYARTNITLSDGRRTNVAMHAMLTGYRQTDHRDRNGLNNQRYNLRDATDRDNHGNEGKHSPSATSRFKGVSWSRGMQQWLAHIAPKGKAIHLGYFPNEIDAARAYDRAAVKHFGKYACTNVMLGLLLSEPS